MGSDVRERVVRRNTRDDNPPLNPPLDANTLQIAKARVAAEVKASQTKPDAAAASKAKPLRGEAAKVAKKTPKA